VGFEIPIPHAFGFACLLAAVAAGATAILIDQATSLAALEQGMRRHRGRVLHGTPSLFARMLATDLDLGVELGFTAGSACPPKVLEALDRDGARILNLYGMTEIGAASACHPDDPPAVRHHTVGRALEGYEFRVADQEVQVRGPFASSYLHRPWADDEASADGWFRTGDLGSLDADGVLTISGRSKDVVHVGGFNVIPAEVESFLLTHPAIEQAAVIGVPHRALGEALRAFVVPDPGAELQPAAVIRFARAGIAGYKVPYQVQVVDELPLLASGKPDRRALADVVQSDSAVA
jgi:long-chain acyl-CoA synthetase